MKRQFKAGAQAKRGIKRMTKLYVEQKNENATLKIKNSVIKANEKYWFDEFEKQVLQNKKCRDHNIELKAELMKLEKQNEQLQFQVDLKQGLINDYSTNEREYLNTIIKQSKIIEEQGVLNFDMKFAYDRMKGYRDFLLYSIALYSIIQLSLYIW